MNAWAVVAYSVLLLAVGFHFGRVYRDLIERLKATNIKSTPAEPEAPKSQMVEPLTPEQLAAKEMRERIARINS